MSGHSKWSKIKREKQVKDVQRSGIFSKISRLITLAVVEGKGVVEPENNLKLRLALEKTKSLNFPKANIERAIEKGVSPNSTNLKETVYEAFGPGGVAILIYTITDNFNRTLNSVRNVVEQNQGKLGVPGSAVHFFKNTGWANFEPYSIIDLGGDLSLKIKELVKALDELEDVQKVITNGKFT